MRDRKQCRQYNRNILGGGGETTESATVHIDPIGVQLDKNFNFAE